MNTDCDWLASVLADQQPHTLNELITRSFRERGCGLTVHSRIADLRKRGLTIENRHAAGAQRGNASIYQLVGSLSEDASPPPSPEASSLSASRISTESRGDSSGMGETASGALTISGPGPEAATGHLGLRVAASQPADPPVAPGPEQLPLIEVNREPAWA